MSEDHGHHGADQYRSPLSNSSPVLQYVNGTFTESNSGSFAELLTARAKLLFAVHSGVAITTATVTNQSIIGVLGAASLTIDGALVSYQTNFVIGQGATLALETDQAALMANSIIDFARPHATLDLNQANIHFNFGSSPRITNFAFTDVVDAQGVDVTSTSYNSANGLLVLYDGNAAVGSLDFKFAPGFTPDFVLTSDGNGGTDISLGQPCFAAGTRILTLRGEVAVEDLKVGEPVVTLSGQGTALKPIRWIGRRRVDITGHPAPEKVRPVRIARGALGENVPHRELVVSPDHALFLDGVLIPAKVLVNGATIVQDDAAREASYFHVELEGHDILLAEGAAAESYLDTGNRNCFTNGGLFAVLHPDFAAKSWDHACAPLAVDGPRVTAVRARLLERVLAAGFALDHDPALRLLADGTPVAGIEVAPGRFRFALPAAEEITLQSGVSVPAEVQPSPGDRRSLGVALTAVAVEEEAGWRAIALDGPEWLGGLHGLESSDGRSWRWTDGRARLRVAPGTRAIEIAIGGSVPRWRLPEAEAEALRA
ncbi:MAG: Hint domain-containing protein [Acetobacteraceae bacterium]